MTESEKTQLSYLFVSLFQQESKELRHKMFDLIECHNGRLPDNLRDVVMLVMAALDYSEEGRA